MSDPKNGTMAAGGVAAMLAVVIVWALSLAHITVPPDVAAAISGLLAAAGAFVVHRGNQQIPQPNPSQDQPPHIGST